jgi:UDP-N-acetylglucosamine 2-epimerase (non-hydrolysing)
MEKASVYRCPDDLPQLQPLVARSPSRLRKKIMFIMGTRPDAIKMIPVIKRIDNAGDEFQPVVVATAQHREMLDQVLQVFHVQPNYDLDIMHPNQSLVTLSALMLQRLTNVIQEVRPDLLFVQGDTTTTFIASLAAFYEKVAVAHIEAGLRTGNKFHPFPEEINRRLTGVLADLHFAPTEKAKGNLLREGVSEKRIFVTGNTGIDALMDVASKKCKPLDPALRDICGRRSRFILVTAHRRESYGGPLVRICNALKEIAEAEPQIKIVYPVHLNPNIGETVKSTIGGIRNIHLIDPLDYASFSQLMRKAYLILTDSGGIQEEAPALGTPVLVMRETSERMEAVEAGAAKIVGTETATIVKETLNLLHNRNEYQEMAQTRLPFGDGQASRRIHGILRKLLILGNGAVSQDF